MFNISNYYEQSRGLPAQNGFQIAILKWADASTLLRETTKLGTVVGLVSSASSVVFNFDPTIALTCTAVCGISWLLTRTCAQKLEPEAQSMIQHFKDLRD
jgi:hypothetical protein